MPNVAKQGATIFAPLTEVIEALSPEKYAEWDRLWMCSDREFGPIHPLIYTHPLSKKKVSLWSGFVLDIPFKKHGLVRILNIKLSFA